MRVMVRGRLLLSLFAAAVFAAAVGAQTPPVRTPPAQTGRSAQTPAPTPPPPPARGVITGRVVSLAITSAPLENARVILSAAPSLLPQNRVARTDKDGRYSFTDLPVGQGFIVTASKTGYAALAYGEAPPASTPKPIDLKLDERVENVDIRLPAQLIVTGKIFDTDGTAFAGALVEALRPFYDQGKRTLVTIAETTTDDRGEYRLIGLAPGQYYISAMDPAFAGVGDVNGALFYGPTYYPGEAVADDATRLTLGPEKPLTSGIDFRLRIIRPARVGGTISSGVQGVALTAGAVTMSPLRNDQASLTSYRVDIRSNNSFEFNNVQPDNYRVQASGETENKGVSYFTQFSLPVSGADFNTDLLPMSPGAVVSGLIKWDPHGNTPPATNKEICVRAPGADGSLFGDALTGYQQENGSFVINGVMVGDHYIRVFNLPEPWHLKAVYMQGKDITDTKISFHYGEKVPDLVVEVTDRTAQVFGKLYADRPDALSTFAVVVFPTNKLLWYPRSRHVQIARPDQKASYRVTGLPPAEYFVAATREVDEGDIGDPRILERLSTMPGTVRQRLVEGQLQPLNLRGVVPRGPQS